MQDIVPPPTVTVVLEPDEPINNSDGLNNKLET